MDVREGSPTPREKRSSDYIFFEKPTTKFVETICCIGAGYVGGPTMAVIAKHCPDIRVIVADIDKRRIDAWNSSECPIYEPQLQEYIVQFRGKNLFFTTDVESAIRESSLIFIAVNTPTKDFGHWGGCGYDLSAYESVSRKIAECSLSSKIVIEKSTVPVRTAERIRKIFESCKQSPEIQFEVVSNPEFLAEGSAIFNLEFPDRVLVGGLDSEEGRKAVAKVASIYKHWVEPSKILTTGLWTAELSKLCCNAFLAQRVSSINSLTALCEATGADIEEVATVLGSDKRIGPHFLRASVGFGGSCFGKDLLGLIYLCESFHLDDVAEYWKQVLKMNDYQKQRFSKLIVQTMFDNVKNKNIGILGFAFKKDTGDTRDSAAIDVCKFLTAEGANLFIYDPKVNHIEINKLFPKAVCVDSPYSVSFESHAIVILTEWDEFKNLDYVRMHSNMARPSFLFDGRNILDHKKLREIGFKVLAIGKPSET